MPLPAANFNSVRQTPLFEGVSDAFFHELFKSATIKEYKKNEHLYHQQDNTQRLFIVIEGWVSLYRSTIEGEQVIAEVVGSGGYFDEYALVSDNGKSLFSAKAVENTRTLEIPYSFFRQDSKEMDALMKRLMRLMLQKSVRQQVKNEHLTLLSAPQRLACLLLRLSENMVGKGGVLTMPYEKSVAAAQLGMKRETFSRALNQLKPWGVTIKGSEIRIESFSRLASYCCGLCPFDSTECSGNRCVSCPLSMHGRFVKEKETVAQYA